MWSVVNGSRSEKSRQYLESKLQLQYITMTYLWPLAACLVAFSAETVWACQLPECCVGRISSYQWQADGPRTTKVELNFDAHPKPWANISNTCEQIEVSWNNPRYFSEAALSLEALGRLRVPTAGFSGLHATPLLRHACAVSGHVPAFGN